MNGFNVYKKIKKPKNELNYKAEGLYLILLGNPNKTVNDIFLNKPKKIKIIKKFTYRCEYCLI